jgi:glycosyltransferase involved in cell wall biosynthesis
MNTYEISVIICNYNHEKWIERTIRSLLHQELINKEDFEIIIVDDCSNDNSKTILKKFDKFNNIQTIYNTKNIGLPASINKAIEKSYGRYIVRVDSDDYVSRKFLFFLKFFLEHNREYQGVACDYLIVNKNEEVIRRAKSSVEEIACGIMFRRECLFDLGLYNTRFEMREGHEIMKRFKKKFKLAFLELPLYKYRQHSKNRTKDKNKLNYFDEIL